MSRKGNSAAKNEGRGVSTWKLQFAFLGGAVAWLLHLLLSYLVAEFGCLTGHGSAGTGGLSLVAWLLLAVAILTFGMASAASLISWKLRSASHHSPKMGNANLTAEDFTARSGLLANLLFVFIILVQSVPIFYFLSDC